jgi:hypothetical protein
MFVAAILIFGRALLGLAIRNPMGGKNFISYFDFSTTRRNVKKSMDGTQPFHGTLLVSLWKKDYANVARNTEPT